MDRREARHLIDAYIASWKDREIDRFLATLSDDAVVIECDGSNARGLEEAQAWFDSWHAEPIGGRVTRWTIRRFLYDEEEEAAAIEWVFGCTCYGKPAAFRGASLVAFDAGRIASIHEYKRLPAESEAVRTGRGHE